MQNWNKEKEQEYYEKIAEKERIAAIAERKAQKEREEEETRLAAIEAEK